MQDTNVYHYCLATEIIKNETFKNSYNISRCAFACSSKKNKAKHEKCTTGQNNLLRRNQELKL